MATVRSGTLGYTTAATSSVPIFQRSSNLSEVTARVVAGEDVDGDKCNADCQHDYEAAKDKHYNLPFFHQPSACSQLGESSTNIVAWPFSCGVTPLRWTRQPTPASTRFPLPGCLFYGACCVSVSVCSTSPLWARNRALHYLANEKLSERLRHGMDARAI
jgi:hypothetical protein